MQEIIRGIPEQIAKGIELGRAAKRDRPYRHIISCGMGGSAIAGEMLSKISNDVIVHWDYDLPVNAGSSDLAVCTSWSGDTEETISSYEKAIALGLETLVITTGGRLAELARANNSPLVILPQDGLAPRMAAGYMVGALFAALGMESHLPTALEPSALEAQGKELAGIIGDRMPVIYAAYPWRKLTGFWKMAYSETAKRQVIANWFPSGAHNEIVGWEGPYQQTVAFLLLQDPAQDARYTKNFDALLAIAAQTGYTAHTVELSGNTPLEKVFNSYILALWTSHFAAQTLGVDAVATKLLDEFKKLKR